MENGRDLGLSIPGNAAVDTGDIPPHVGALAFAEGRRLDLRIAQ